MPDLTREEQMKVISSLVVVGEYELANKIAGKLNVNLDDAIEKLEDIVSENPVVHL